MISTTLDNETYHAHKALGSTTAKLVLTSRQLLKDAIDGIYSLGHKPCFDIGTVSHTMVLEPDEFAKLFTSEGPINPKTGNMYGRGTKAFLEWQEQNPGLTVVEPFLWRMLERMPQELREVFALPGIAESSVIVDNDGWQAKCRPDWLCDTVIYDYKTIDNIDNIHKQTDNLHYDFSAEWYKDVMKMETGKTHTHELIFAEKKPPHRWRILKPDLEDVMLAQDQYFTAKEVINTAFKTGEWSDQSEVVVDWERPSFSKIHEEYDYAL